MKCPTCGNKYPKGVKYCPDCGVELEKDTSQSPSSSQEGEKKKCPHCGTMNPSVARFCKDCGKEMEEEKEVSETSRPPAILELPSGQEVAIKKEEQWLGREDFVDFVEPKKAKYISRNKHFKIFYENGDYYILDEESTNNTLLEDTEIRGEGKKKLSGKDNIKIADEIPLEFKVGS
ncbi:MAG: zinc-ribbon domain-containing protein [Candidatus Saliniplasma sp.]